MTIVVPNAAEEAFLDLMLSETLSLKLFTNDVEAGLTEAQIEALTAASFTEATFTGYSAKSLTGGSWVSTQGDDYSYARYAQQTFTRTSTGTAQQVRGYYVIKSSTGAIRWYEYFPGPLTVTNNGDAISMTPEFTLDDNKEAIVTALGIVDQFEATANTAALTADTATDMVLNNEPVVAGRTYAFHLHTWANLSAATGDWDLMLRVNGTIVDRLAYVQNTAATAENRLLDGWCYWTAPTTQATDDFDVYANEVAGTANLTLLASATGKRTFTMHDVGVL